jgi:hypothetical protein
LIVPFSAIIRHPIMRSEPVHRCRPTCPPQEVIGDVNNHSLGIVDVRGRPRPALEGFRRAVALFAGPLRPADDQVQVTRPIASRAEVHCFEAPDGGLTAVAWQRTSVVGDGRRQPAGQAPPLAAESFTLTVPGRRLHLAPDAPTSGILEVLDRDEVTSIRMGVTQERTSVFRLIP